MKETPIDLHVHTTFSDGTLTPTEVTRIAQRAGLRAIAITDHDTVRGNKEAIDEGRKLGVEVVPGVEVSADFQDGTMHILGYYIDPDCRSLVEVLQRIENARHKRNEEILERLGRLGMALDYEAIKDAASEGTVGRPHIAQALVQEGYVRTLREAFNRYLKKGGPAYADRLRFSEIEAVRSICQAGGIAVLGHPSSLNCEDSHSLATIVERLVSVGVQGVEAYYPSSSVEMRRSFERLAAQYGLLLTGGTDFHGAIYPEIELGFGHGDMHVPYSLLEDMKARVAANKSGTVRKSVTPEQRTEI